MPERRQLLQSFRTKPRRCKDVIGVIYAVGGQTKSGNSLSTVEVYDPITVKFTTVYQFFLFLLLYFVPHLPLRYPDLYSALYFEEVDLSWANTRHGICIPLP